jgi:hypothetical protein
MKILSLIVFLTFSIDAFSRQYIQCTHADYNLSDVMVINLPSSQSGTAFFSSGMENSESERVLFEIELSKIENDSYFYRVSNNSIDGFISVPTKFIGVSSNQAWVNVALTGYNADFICFSRLYHD